MSITPRTPKGAPLKGTSTSVPTGGTYIKDIMKQCNFSSSYTDKFEFYKQIVSATSALAPPDCRLTDIEIDTLSHFLSLPKEHDFYPFSPKARKEIMKKYPGKITVQTLSSRIISIINKGYLVRDDDNFIDFSPSIKKLRHIDTFNVLLLYRPDSKTDGRDT